MKYNYISNPNMLLNDAAQGDCSGIRTKTIENQQNNQQNGNKKYYCEIELITYFYKLHKQYDEDNILSKAFYIIQLINK